MVHTHCGNIGVTVEMLAGRLGSAQRSATRFAEIVRTSQVCYKARGSTKGTQGCAALSAASWLAGSPPARSNAKLQTKPSRSAPKTSFQRTMGSGSQPDKMHRSHYKYWLPIQTRWSDNDMYGHVNNVMYYSFFDTVVNHFLINQAQLRPTKSSEIGLCVHSACDYYAPLEYPDIIEAGLYVSTVGNSSLKYEVGIFKVGEERPAAHGHFVHVFVDAETRKKTSIPPAIKAAVNKSLL